MKHSLLFSNIVKSLKKLPGIGERSAQRISLEILNNNKQLGLNIANLLIQGINELTNCDRCNILTEKPICDICESPKRDRTKICVVESPSNLVAIENTGLFNGSYFVLKGLLSPIDGIGPNEIGLDKMELLLKQNKYNEVILALSATVEGEATGYYIANMAKKHNADTTKIAHGIPMGGELEFIDAKTISTALSHRLKMNN